MRPVLTRTLPLWASIGIAACEADVLSIPEPSVVTISGQVTRVTNAAPVPEAEVSVLRLSTSPLGTLPGLFASTITDAQGQYSIQFPTSSACEEPYSIQATWEEFSGFAGLGCRPTDGQIDVALVPGTFATAQPVFGDLTWSALATGFTVSCGIELTGTLYCWGARLGTGEPPEIAWVPRDMETTFSMASVSLKGGTGCGLDVFARAHCWGDNTFGQLGDGGTQSRPYPALVTGNPPPFAEVETAGRSVCGLAQNQRVWCWGSNAFLQLGVEDAGSECTDQYGGTFPCAFEPIEVASELVFTAIATSSGAVCGLADEGRALCWGDSWGDWEFDEQGRSTARPPSTTPVAVVGERRFVEIVGDGGMFCGLTEAGDVYCWFNGAHENGSRAPVAEAVLLVPTGGPVKAPLTVWFTRGCAERLAGGWACWENIYEGVLSAQPLPRSDLVVVRVGDSHSCGLTSDGTAYCWGYGGQGQLGAN